ncbi:hypothetical protein QR680_011204 [Steinernema hermaphroditum]|uniref:RING-CH-type domain-containing protein n=1 Tax=Steinernema hermaphroditum TaxID=289476 RepID=A0AA39IRH0_9BILA|nr:hypothetical protein QR680_011204 [Steinernema hermaphroditum]
MDEEGVICRICYVGADEEPLYSPCKCSGTVKYIHQTCWELLVEHRTNLDGKCELCHHPIQTMEVTVDKGNVTWTVYIYALGMYLLVSALRITMIVSQLAVHFLSGFPSALLSLISYRLFEIWEGWAELELGDSYYLSRLPYIGRVHSEQRIRNVNFKMIRDHDGFLAFVLCMLAVTEYYVIFPIDSELDNGLKEMLTWFISDMKIANTSFSTDSLTILGPPVPINYVTNIMVVMIAIFIIVNYCIEGETHGNAMFASLHSLWIGYFVALLITHSCKGWIIDSFNPILHLVLTCTIATYYLIFMPTIELCGDYCDEMDLEFDHEILLYPFVHRDMYDNVKSALTSMICSNLHVIGFVALPLLATSRFFRHWLFLGEYLKPDYTFTITGKHGELIDVATILGGVNMAVKVFFVVHWLCTAWFLYDWFFCFQDFVYKRIFHYDKLADKRLSVTLDAILWPPVFSLFITSFCWFVVLLGRSVFSFGLLPSYFDVYQNDLFAHLAIGFSIVNFFYMPLMSIVKYTFIIASCLCVALAYSTFFTSSAFAPLRTETVFMATWMIAELRWNRDHFGNLKYYATISAFLLSGSAPAHIIRFVYGFDGLLAAFSSRTYIFFCAISVTGLCVLILKKLSFHLKFEYGEIKQQLVDYKPRSVIAHRSVKKMLDEFLRGRRDWSICNWLKLKNRQLINRYFPVERRKEE